jgi:hypothetical protein
MSGLAAATMTDKVIGGIANIRNPQNVLQEPRSKITTNPFIPEAQRTAELDQIQDQANAIIEQQYLANRTSTIQNMSLKEIMRNISNSVIGFLDDVLNKPGNIRWRDYIPKILKQDQRYTYIGFVLIAVVFFFALNNTY